jgi:hypothetical protein
MTFAVYLPPQAATTKVPSLYWLSGLSSHRRAPTRRPVLPSAQENRSLCRSVHRRELFDQVGVRSRGRRTRRGTRDARHIAARRHNRGRRRLVRFWLGCGLLCRRDHAQVEGELRALRRPDQMNPLLHGARARSAPAPRPLVCTRCPTRDLAHALVLSLSRPRQNMYTYVTSELPALVEATLADKIVPGKRSIFGAHSRARSRPRRGPRRGHARCCGIVGCP